MRLTRLGVHRFVQDLERDGTIWTENGDTTPTTDQDGRSRRTSNTGSVDYGGPRDPRRWRALTARPMYVDRRRTRRLTCMGTASTSMSALSPTGSAPAITTVVAPCSWATRRPRRRQHRTEQLGSQAQAAWGRVEARSLQRRGKR